MALVLLGWGPAGPEREVVVNMLNSLSRNQPLPQITPRCGCTDPLRGRLPFQGYESACSGRHYCLRGMNYCVTRAPGTKRHLQPLGLMLPTVRFAGPRPAHAGPLPNKPFWGSPDLPGRRALHPAPPLALTCLHARSYPASSPPGPGIWPRPIPQAPELKRTTKVGEPAKRFPQVPDPAPPQLGSRSTWLLHLFWRPHRRAC